MGDPCGGSSALVDFIEIDHRGVSMVEVFYEWPLEYGEVAVDIVEGIGSANGVFQGKWMAKNELVWDKQAEF